MRIAAVLNRHGGMLRSIDIDAYCDRLSRLFSDHGHSLDCSVVAGADIAEALKNAFRSDRNEAVVAGGGDGTVSAAAGLAWTTGKAVGVIPAGTMNMFARSLAVPLDLDEAAAALASGRICACDIASANGRPFVHQFSVGLQPRVVKERSRYQYTTRVGKMIAGIKAILASLSRPPAFPMSLTIEEMTRRLRLSLISISNNPYGEGHLPYADRLDTGELGVYYAGALNGSAGMRLTADLAIGSWSANPDFRCERAREVVLEFPALKRGANAVMDGELLRLDRNVELKIHAGELRVLAPAKKSSP